MKLLNVGCGGHRHPAWINLDLIPVGPDIQPHDLHQPLPFQDHSFDALYHSHVLEHLAPGDGERLIRECYRVLRPQGVLRVVVPDLEGIAREYLSALDRCRTGNLSATADHQWMSLELFDQMVRSRSGGAMAIAMSAPHLPNTAFVRARMGAEFSAQPGEGKGYERQGSWHRVAVPSVGRLLRFARETAASWAVWALAGPRGYAALREGLFRHSGEIHRWMYDSISLAELLERCGFENIARCSADESRIASFATYELDTVGGEVRKPDSLFLEGIRPAR